MTCVLTCWTPRYVVASSHLLISRNHKKWQLINLHRNFIFKSNVEENLMHEVITGDGYWRGRWNITRVPLLSIRESCLRTLIHAISENENTFFRGKWRETANESHLSFTTTNRELSTCELRRGEGRGTTIFLENIADDSRSGLCGMQAGNVEKTGKVWKFWDLQRFIFEWKIRKFREFLTITVFPW